MHKGFFKAGHLPTLFAAFFYFDMSFMVWVLLGPLGVAIAKSLHLDPGHKGLMVATPVFAGAALRVVLGLLVDRFKARRVGIGAQVVVIAGLITAWAIGIDSFAATLLLGCVLGLAGASFAVALPLASALVSAGTSGDGAGYRGCGELRHRAGGVVRAGAGDRVRLAERHRPGCDPADAGAAACSSLPRKDSPNTPAPKPLAGLLRRC